MVQDVVNNVGNTDRELINMLQRISQYENIPRKKPKFIVSFNICFIFTAITQILYFCPEFP